MSGFQWSPVQVKDSSSDATIYVLQGAVEEHRQMIEMLLCGRLIKYFSGIYSDSVTKAEDPSCQTQGKCASLVLFQEHVQQIPKWSMEHIEKVSAEMFSDPKKSHERLKNALGMMISAKTAVLGSVCPKRKTLEVKVPSSYDFLHEVLIGVAEFLYKHPMTIVPREDDQADLRREKVLERKVTKIIDNIIIGFTPYDELLCDRVDEPAAAAPPADDNPVPVESPVVVPAAETPAAPAEEVQPPSVESDPVSPEQKSPKPSPPQNPKADPPPELSDTESEPSVASTDSELYDEPPPTTTTTIRKHAAPRHSSRLRPIRIPRH